MSPRPERGWSLGPLRLIADETWPELWLSYCDETFAKAEPDDRPDLLARLAHVGPWGRDYGREQVQHVDVFAIDGGWLVKHPTTFSGVYTSATRTVDITIDEHLMHPHVTFANVLRGLVSALLPTEFGGLMMHASSGILDGRGLVFSGVSTAGKTTLALGMEEAKFLSDDISLIADLAAAPHLIPSPFFGSAGRRGFDLDAPLAAFCILYRKEPEQTYVEAVNRAQAVAEILRHVVCFSTDTDLHKAILSRVVELTERVPVFKVARYIGTSSDEVCQRVLAEVDRRGT